MEILDDIKLDHRHSSKPTSLAEQVKEMEERMDFLEDESIVYHRRLWKNYMDMVCFGHILEKLKKRYGEDDVQRIIDDFMRYERPDALQKQIELAQKGEWSIEFIDLANLLD